MKKIILNIFITIAFTCNVLSENATITFKSDKDISVWIKAPIDRVSNPYVYTDSIILSQDTNCDYKVDVNDFSFIECMFSDGRLFDIVEFIIV